MKEELKIKISLVDDDPLYLKLLVNEFIKNQNIEITTFATGEAFLNRSPYKPDIVVLDYFLNSRNKDAQNGYEILVKLKEVEPDVQVIILSSTENVEIALNCVKYNAFNYIVKNETAFLRLKQSIKNILQLYSKEKELIVWDW